MPPCGKMWQDKPCVDHGTFGAVTGKSVGVFDTIWTKPLRMDSEITLRNHCHHQQGGDSPRRMTEIAGGMQTGSMRAVSVVFMSQQKVTNHVKNPREPNQQQKGLGSQDRSELLRGWELVGVALIGCCFSHPLTYSHSHVLES